MAPPPEEEKGGGCCARWLRREVLLALALGQLVSLLITSTGFSSSELARRGAFIRGVPPDPRNMPGGRPTADECLGFQSLLFLVFYVR